MSQLEAIDLDALTYQQPTLAVVRAALPILDAELVAVDDVPVKAPARRPAPDTWVVGHTDFRQSWWEDPFKPLVCAGLHCAGCRR